MAAAKAVWRSSSGGGDRREPAWILGFKPKRTNLHEKYDYPFFEYRDLGIREATQGRFAAHVIRAAAGTEFASQPHLHRTEFQLVYVLKGWIEFEYEGQGRVRLEAGSCVHQPPGIRHRELGQSDDVELLEIVLPANFATEEVGSVNG